MVFRLQAEKFKILSIKILQKLASIDEDKKVLRADAIIEILDLVPAQVQMDRKVFEFIFRQAHRLHFIYQ